MDPSRLTRKSQEALQDAQQRAPSNGHQQLEPEHLLQALLEQPEGLVPRLLSKGRIEVSALSTALAAELGRLPRVSGAPDGQIYVSQRLSRVLVPAPLTK